jgi:hypothetical protein
MHFLAVLNTITNSQLINQYQSVILQHTGTSGVTTLLIWLASAFQVNHCARWCGTAQKLFITVDIILNLSTKPKEHST